MVVETGVVTVVVEPQVWWQQLTEAKLKREKKQQNMVFPPEMLLLKRQYLPNINGSMVYTLFGGGETTPLGA